MPLYFPHLDYSGITLAEFVRLSQLAQKLNEALNVSLLPPTEDNKDKNKALIHQSLLNAVNLLRPEMEALQKKGTGLSTYEELLSNINHVLFDHGLSEDTCDELLDLHTTSEQLKTLLNDATEEVLNNVTSSKDYFKVWGERISTDILGEVPFNKGNIISHINLNAAWQWNTGDENFEDYVAIPKKINVNSKINPVTFAHSFLKTIKNPEKVAAFMNCPEDFVGLFEQMQRCTLMAMLGQGDAKEAYHGFLKQADLKNGIYNFDVDKIDHILNAVDTDEIMEVYEDLWLAKADEVYNDLPQLDKNGYYSANEGPLSQDSVKNMINVAKAARDKDQRHQGILWSIKHFFFKNQEKELLNRTVNTLKQYGIKESAIDQLMNTSAGGKKQQGLLDKVASSIDAKFKNDKIKREEAEIEHEKQMKEMVEKDWEIVENQSFDYIDEYEEEYENDARTTDLNELNQLHEKLKTDGGSQEIVDDEQEELSQDDLNVSKESFL